MKTEYFIGLDLGQSQDFTAIGVIEKTEVRLADRNPVTWAYETESRLQLRYMRRLPLGMAYPDMVSKVCELIEPLAVAGDCTLIVDATGVGAPVVDLIRSMGPACRIMPVHITGANRESQADGTWYVPKRDLVTGLQVMFQEARLQISARLVEVPALLHELMQMRVKISSLGHDSYGCWRDGEHDDLVLALALACWRAKRELPPIWGTRPLF
jgi:hypothetical protein